MFLNKLLLVGGGVGALLILLYLNSKKGESVKAPISLDELTQKYSSGCDRMIINALKESPELSYVSGYFIVSLDETAKKVNIKAQLFFQTKANEWVEKISTDTLQISRLRAEDIYEIRKAKEIKYEVEEPEVQQLVQNK